MLGDIKGDIKWMRKLLSLLLLSFFLSFQVFSETKYYITETQLNGFENTILYQNQMLESQREEYKNLYQQFQESEQNNELMNKIIIGETVIVLTLLPITIILAMHIK